MKVLESHTPFQQDDLLRHILQYLSMVEIFAMSRVSKAFHEVASNQQTHEDKTLELVSEGERKIIWIDSTHIEHCVPRHDLLAKLIVDVSYNIKSYDQSFADLVSNAEKKFILYNEFPNLQVFRTEVGIQLETIENYDLIKLMQQCQYIHTETALEFPFPVFLPNLKMISAFENPCIDLDPIYTPNLRVVLMVADNSLHLLKNFPSVEFLLIDLNIADAIAPLHISSLESVKMLGIDHNCMLETDAAAQHFVSRCQKIIGNCPNLIHVNIVPPDKEEFYPTIKSLVAQYPHIHFTVESLLPGFGAETCEIEEYGHRFPEILEELEEMIS